MYLPKILILAFASLASARAVVGSTEQMGKVVAPLTLNDTCVPIAVVRGHAIGCHNFDRDWATKPKTTGLAPREPLFNLLFGTNNTQVHSVEHVMTIEGESWHDFSQRLEGNSFLRALEAIRANKTDLATMRKNFDVMLDKTAVDKRETGAENSTAIWGNAFREMNVTLAIAEAFAELEKMPSPLSSLRKGNETAAVEKRDPAAGSWSIQEAAMNATIAATISDSVEKIAKALAGVSGPLTQYGKGNETAVVNSTALEKRDQLGSGTGGHQMMYCPGWPTAVRHNLTHYKIWHFRCFCTRYHLIERQDCSYGWVNNQGPNF